MYEEFWGFATFTEAIYLIIWISFATSLTSLTSLTSFNSIFYFLSFYPSFIKSSFLEFFYCNLIFYSATGVLWSLWSTFIKLLPISLELSLTLELVLLRFNFMLLSLFFYLLSFCLVTSLATDLVWIGVASLDFSVFRLISSRSIIILSGDYYLLVSKFLSSSSMLE